MKSLFSLERLPVIVTGAAGLLGRNHSHAIAEAGGIPILCDIDEANLVRLSKELASLGCDYRLLHCDSTDEQSVEKAAADIRKDLGPIFGIVNNVATNPPMDQSPASDGSLEGYSYSQWQRDHDVSLGSIFLMAKYFGPHLVERGRGSIVNVASDLALISPDQRIYVDKSLNAVSQSKKPMSYSSTKTAVLGITRYLATYWAPLPIRSNALVPGSVKGTQSASLTANLEARIPLARLASEDEYKGAIIFLLSDASSYMNGASLVIDGGRSIW